MSRDRLTASALLTRPVPRTLAKLPSVYARWPGPLFCFDDRFSMASSHVFSAPVCLRAFPCGYWSHTVPTARCTQPGPLVCFLLGTRVPIELKTNNPTIQFKLAVNFVVLDESAFVLILFCPSFGTRAPVCLRLRAQEQGKHASKIPTATAK